MCVCAYTCLGRPETNKGYPPQLFPTFLFETGPLTELASRLVSKHAPPSAEGTDLRPALDAGARGWNSGPFECAISTLITKLPPWL